MTAEASQQQDDIAMRARETRIERLLGRPIPTEQRALVRAALLDNDEVWATYAVSFVPDGTEPAFVFTPTRLPMDAPVENGHE